MRHDIVDRGWWERAIKRSGGIINYDAAEIDTEIAAKRIQIAIARAFANKLEAEIFARKLKLHDCRRTKTKVS